jgi:hypothetical protein
MAGFRPRESALNSIPKHLPIDSEFPDRVSIPVQPAVPRPSFRESVAQESARIYPMTLQIAGGTG